MRKAHTEAMAKALPYIFILMFISGVTAGSLFARFSAEGIAFDIFSAPKMSVFIKSFKSFLKPCMIIWVFGFTKFSVYFSAGTLAYRGALLGFVNTCFFKEFGLARGLTAALSASLPQNALFFPFLLFLSIIASGQTLTRKPLNYIIILAFSIFVCAFSALIDTYITSYLINITF